MIATLRARFDAQFADTDLRAIIAAIASISAVGTGLGLSAPLLSLLMERDGISTSLIGMNNAISGIAAIMIIPFITVIARQFGVVNALLANIAISSLSFLAFYFTSPLPDWYVLRFVLSVSLPVLFVLSEFWINHAAQDHNRGMILGIYGTVLSIGFAIGPAILAIVGIDGIRPFAIGAVLMLMAALPVWFARNRQPILQRDEKTPSMLPFIFAVPLASAAGFTFGAVEQTQLSLLPVFGTSAGYSAGQAALLLTMVGIGNVIFQIPLGILSDRVFERRKMLLVCAIIGLAGVLAMPAIINTPGLMYALVVPWGGVVGGMYIIGLAHLGARLKGSDLAQANAAFVFCYCIGLIIGPQLTGISMDLFGPAGFSAGVAALFGGFIAVYAIRGINRTHQR